MGVRERHQVRKCNVKEMDGNDVKKGGEGELD